MYVPRPGNSLGAALNGAAWIALSSVSRLSVENDGARRTSISAPRLSSRSRPAKSPIRESASTIASDRSGATTSAKTSVSSKQNRASSRLPLSPGSREGVIPRRTSAAANSSSDRAERSPCLVRANTAPKPWSSAHLARTDPSWIAPAVNRIPREGDCSNWSRRSGQKRSSASRADRTATSVSNGCTPRHHCATKSFHGRFSEGRRLTSFSVNDSGWALRLGYSPAPVRIAFSPTLPRATASTLTPLALPTTPSTPGNSFELFTPPSSNFRSTGSSLRSYDPTKSL